MACLWDPGAAMTIVNTPVIDSLGYSAQMGKRERHLLGPGGEPLPGYTLDVRLEVFGEKLDPFEVLAQDIMPEHLGVEVLLGMDLVPGRIFILDGVRGTLPSVTMMMRQPTARKLLCDDGGGKVDSKDHVRDKFQGATAGPGALCCAA